MKPIKFNGANVTFGEDQPIYEPLYAAYDKDDPTGRVVSCWQLSDEEIQEVVKTGHIWLAQLSFHRPINPVFMTPYREAVIEEPLNEE